MEEDILNKIKLRLAELPPDVQQAVQSADLGARIQKIGTKHHLHIDQMGNLQDEVYLVMLGFEDPDAFSQNLATNLHIPIEQAAQIAADVSAEAFLPIRESMQVFAEKQEMAEVAVDQKLPPPKTPPPQTLPPPAPAATPQKPSLSAADMMLSQKTVSMSGPNQTAITPAAAPTRGESYKVDPYREPTE